MSDVASPRRSELYPQMPGILDFVQDAVMVREARLLWDRPSNDPRAFDADFEMELADDHFSQPLLPAHRNASPKKSTTVTRKNVTQRVPKSRKSESRGRTTSSPDFPQCSPPRKAKLS